MKDLKLSASTINFVGQELTKLVSKDSTKHYRVSISDWKKKRSLSANRQQHLWYSQIAKYEDDKSSEYVKRFCKYTFGLPILLNSDKHADFYESLFDACNLWKRSYENRIELMEGVEVTSKFNTAESKEYMDQMIFYFNDIGIPIKYKD